MCVNSISTVILVNDMCWAASINFIISLILLNSRVRIFSASPSALGWLIIVGFLIPLIPGFWLVSIANVPMSYGLSNAMDSDTLRFTYWFSVMGMSVTFLLLYLSSFIIDYNYKLGNFKFRRSIAYALAVCSIAIGLTKILSVGDIPVIMALSGNRSGAALQKALILQGRGLGGVGIGYWVQYSYYITLVYLIMARRQGKIGRLFICGYIGFACVYAVYDLQKYNFIFMWILMFAVYSEFKKIKFVRLIKYGGGMVIILIFAFSLLPNDGSKEILQSIATRTFIGQTEGSYMIYGALKPDIGRALRGAPAILGDVGDGVVDPAAQVVRIYFPTADDSWVNANSFVLADAWASFGAWAIIIAPFLIVFNVVIVYLLGRFTRRYLGAIAPCVAFVLIITLRVNNSFSYFLYAKALMAFASLGVFGVIVMMISRFVLISSPVTKRGSERC